MHQAILNFCNGALYSTVLFFLSLIDYILGNGFVNMLQEFFCNISCFMKKTIREEQKVLMAGVEKPISLPVLFAEMLVLLLTIAMLNKYKQFRGKDRIDTLLQESMDALRQTDDFLEKWRLRRANCPQPAEYSYLDDEPQEIRPLKLEIPILHMAIVDTLGTAKCQPESGDAGETTNLTDSTLLSMTSLINNGIDVQEEPSLESVEVDLEFNNRYLWDVVEEDDNSLEI